MNRPPRNIVILGSTGSIGCNALEVATASGGSIRVAGLTANRSLDTLCGQAQQCRPDWVFAADQHAASQHDWSVLPSETKLITSTEEMHQRLSEESVDVVVAAVVGAAGLDSAWAAVAAGKTLALANKETLVVAGELVTKLAADNDVPILPVDSEHSAVYQALQAGKRSEVKRIVLTASGGPFRDHTQEQLASVTVDDALAHPTWDMGPKITVDSATMMNKALEIIEARWLFDLPPGQIDVVVHPQSIVHSFVEFCDGSLIAQMGPPDMKLPIQYAITYPDRCPSPAHKMDMTKAFSLDFQPPDQDRFPALKLGYEVAERGGTTGVVLNAANEAAVAAFLDGELAFTDIVSACKAVLDNHDYDSNPSLTRLHELDDWARKEISRWVYT